MLAAAAAAAAAAAPAELTGPEELKQRQWRQPAGAGGSSEDDMAPTTHLGRRLGRQQHQIRLDWQFRQQRHARILPHFIAHPSYQLLCCITVPRCDT